MEKHNSYTINRMAYELAKSYHDLQLTRQMWLDAEDDESVEYWNGARHRDQAHFRAQEDLCEALGLFRSDESSFFGEAFQSSLALCVEEAE